MIETEDLKIDRRQRARRRQESRASEAVNNWGAGGLGASPLFVEGATPRGLVSSSEPFGQVAGRDLQIFAGDFQGRIGGIIFSRNRLSKCGFTNAV